MHLLLFFLEDICKCDHMSETQVFLLMQDMNKTVQGQCATSCLIIMLIKYVKLTYATILLPVLSVAFLQCTFTTLLSERVAVLGINNRSFFLSGLTQTKVHCRLKGVQYHI